MAGAVSAHGAGMSGRTVQLDHTLCLRRKPDNLHDSNAIEVLTPDGMKLGCVLRSYNT